MGSTEIYWRHVAKWCWVSLSRWYPIRGYLEIAASRPAGCQQQFNFAMLKDHFEQETYLPALWALLSVSILPACTVSWLMEYQVVALVTPASYVRLERMELSDAKVHQTVPASLLWRLNKVFQCLIDHSPIQGVWNIEFLAYWARDSKLCCPEIEKAVERVHREFKDE